MTDTHIVPFGSRLTPQLITYLLDLTGKEYVNVSFIPTAVGDAHEYVTAFYNRFPKERVRFSHLALFNRTVVDIPGYLMDQDVIMVCGGNTASMLAVWRTHGVDVALRDAWQAGKVMTGGSAGSLCWFECGTTDSFDLAKLAPLYDGLGFLPGSHCPHYDGEDQRRPLYQRLVGEGFPAGYAIDDDAAIHFVGTEIAEVVTATEGSTAYRVEKQGEQVVETALTARLLPA